MQLRKNNGLDSVVWIYLTTLSYHIKAQNINDKNDNNKEIE